MASLANLYRHMEMLNVYFMSLPSINTQVDQMIQSISVLLFEEHNGDDLRNAITELIPANSFVSKDLLERSDFYEKFKQFITLRGLKPETVDGDGDVVCEILNTVYGYETHAEVMQLYYENKRKLELETGEALVENGNCASYDMTQRSFHDIERAVQSMSSIDLLKPIHQTEKEVRFEGGATELKEYFPGNDRARQKEIKKMGKSFSKWLKGFSR